MTKYMFIKSGSIVHKVGKSWKSPVYGLLQSVRRLDTGKEMIVSVRALIKV